MLKSLTFPFRLLKTEEIAREDLSENVEYLLKTREQDGLPEFQSFFQGKIFKSIWPKDSYPLYNFQGFMDSYMFHRCKPQNHWHKSGIILQIEDRRNTLIELLREKYLSWDNLYEKVDVGTIDLDFINDALLKNIEKYKYGGDGRIPDWWQKEKVPVSHVSNAFAVSHYSRISERLFKKMFHPKKSIKEPDYRNMIIKAEFERPIEVGDSNQFSYDPLNGSTEEGAYQGRREYQTAQLKFDIDKDKKLTKLTNLNLFED